jgi:hypothetical protein
VNGVEVMIRVGPGSTASVDAAVAAGTFPILVVEVTPGQEMLLTPEAGFVQDGAIEMGDLAFADQLMRAARLYRNSLARRLGVPDVP